MRARRATQGIMARTRTTRSSARGEVLEEGLDNEQSLKKNHNKRKSTEALQPARILTVSARDRKIRKRALELFQQPLLLDLESKLAKDKQQEELGPDMVELPVMYAALKRIQTIGHGAWWQHYQQQQESLSSSETNNYNVPQPTNMTHEPETDLSDDELELIRNASLAVPLLMMRKVYDSLVLPRTMGGLAWSDAKAKKVAKALFVKMGPACCGEQVSEQDLVDKCGGKAKKKGAGEPEDEIVILKRPEAHKLLPLLKTVGQEARSQVEEIYAQLEEGLEDDDDDDDDSIAGNGSPKDDNMGKRQKTDND